MSPALSPLTVLRADSIERLNHDVSLLIRRSEGIKGDYAVILIGVHGERV
jgi:hypothetical protein